MVSRRVSEKASAPSEAGLQVRQRTAVTHGRTSSEAIMIRTTARPATTAPVVVGLRGERNRSRKTNPLTTSTPE